jgi:hypothetical protein
LPTITATAHQVLRYFFVGVLAVVFVAIPPGEGWSGRFALFLKDWVKTMTEAAGVAIAMLIGGSLVYIAHRVVVYPLIFRWFVILRVLGEETSERGLRRWWPYGHAVSGELHLERLGAHLPETDRQRFNGWSSEIHLCYLATEIALFTLYLWPGWRVTDRWPWGLGLCLLLFLTAAWDRQAVSLLVDRARNRLGAANTTAPAATPE